jgi:predicted RNA-binding protein with PIN domain
MAYFNFILQKQVTWLGFRYGTRALGGHPMKQIILDGYNVIYELPVLKNNLMMSLENTRTALVDFMQIWVNNHAYKGKINIVFDGTDGFTSDNQSLTNNSRFFFNNSQTTRSNNQHARNDSQHASSNSQFTQSNSQFTQSNSQPTLGINCIYSRSGQKADDYIICMVREIKNRSCITIVSNDNYVRDTCSSLGAATERPSFLIDSPKVKARKINSQKSSKKISPKQEKEINEFLKEKWGIK